MKLLIKSEAELKSYTGVSVALSITSMQSHLRHSRAEQAVKGILGESLYENLLDAYDEASMTPAQEALLPYAQRPLAALAVYSYMQEGSIHIADGGITTNRDKAAFQWQQEKGERYYLQSAYDALDLLIEFLLKNRDDYDWSGSDFDLLQQGALVPDTSTFQRYVNINQSYRTYRAVQAVLLNAEDQYLRPLLTDTLTDELKVAIKEGTTSADDKALLRYVQPALCYLTMADAIQDLNMELSGDGAYLHSLRATSNANIVERQKPGTNELDRAAERLRQRGQDWLEKTRTFLNANASSTKYSSYYNSSQYSDPAASSQSYTQDTDSNLYNAL